MTSDHTTFFIRALQYEDIPEVVCLPKSEGREMGQEAEVATWLSRDPNGIHVAIDESDGSIAGCCSGIALTEHHGYIGMFVVKDKYRGMGVGRVLWNAAINRLGCRNVSLSSGDLMLGFYKKKGFELSATWTVDLYSTSEAVLPEIPCSRPLPFTVTVKTNGPFLQRVLEYDFATHQYDRSTVVRDTVGESGTLTLVSLKPRWKGRLQTTGYACMKKTLQGRWLIAPLYADDEKSARSLLYGLISTLSDEQIREGVVAKLVSTNLDAAKLFMDFGLRKTDYKLNRLFTRQVFDIPETKVFALQTSVFCTE